MRLLQFVSLVSHVFDRYLNPSLIISCLKSILLIIKFSILYHYCISTLRPNQTSIFCTPLVIILVTYLMSINSWYLMWRKIWCAFSTRSIPSWYRVESTGTAMCKCQVVMFAHWVPGAALPLMEERSELSYHRWWHVNCWWWWWPKE